jgi:hypothetical protein
MSDLATRTSTALVAATSRQLGVTLPEKLQRAIDDANTLREHGAQFNAQPVAQAVAEAVLANRDPLTSKAVQNAVLAATLGQLNLEAQMSQYAFSLSAHALRECADEVIDTWRPAVQAIGQTFANFRDIVPGVDPLSADLPTGLPTRALTPWGEAKEAAARLGSIVKGWQSIASLCGVSVDTFNRPLILAELSLEQLREMGDRPKPEAVARFDVPVDLASLSTFHERLQRLTDERNAQQAYADAAPERAREDRRKAMGVVMIP